MSSFTVEAFPLQISPHDNADKLELAHVGGYRSIVGKGQYQDGELAIYIPTDALLPESVLRDLDMWNEEENKGTLSGKTLGNRVRPKRLRRVLSEGIVYKPAFELEEGTDYAQILGIKKYEPIIPANAQGRLVSAPGLESYTDIENMQKALRKGGMAFDLLNGHEVVISEKLHGSCCIFYHDGHEFYASSKGRASQSIALEKPEDVRTNWYWHAAALSNMPEKLAALHEKLGKDRVTVYGEVFGQGVQDLGYGVSGKVDFRAFDLRVNHEFVDYDTFASLMNEFEIDTVPYLYRGICTAEVVDTHTNGKTTFGSGHIREGVVIRPVREIQDDELGRLVLKSVSVAYKTRKGGTEYN